jgi:8-oxo-dGTP diphosphatase
MAPSDLLASAVPRVGVAVFVLHHFPQTATQTHAVPPYFLQTQSQRASPKAYKFLLGKRLGSHGHGTYALPGGHLEFGETFEECALREVKEETDLDIERVEFLTSTNDIMEDEGGVGDGKEASKRKHYVTIFMTATIKGGGGEGNGGKLPEVKLMEPEKCAGWEWIGWEDLVRWAGPQIRALGYGDRDAKAGAAETMETEDGRILFSPMIALLVQRPDAVPRLP